MQAALLGNGWVTEYRSRRIYSAVPYPNLVTRPTSLHSPTVTPGSCRGRICHRGNGPAVTVTSVVADVDTGTTMRWPWCGWRPRAADVSTCMSPPRPATPPRHWPPGTPVRYCAAGAGRPVTAGPPRGCAADHDPGDPRPGGWGTGGRARGPFCCDTHRRGRGGGLATGGAVPPACRRSGRTRPRHRACPEVLAGVQVTLMRGLHLPGNTTPTAGVEHGRSACARPMHCRIGRRAPRRR